MSTTSRDQNLQRTAEEEAQAALDARAEKIGLPAGTPEEVVEAAELDKLAETGDESADRAEATVLTWLLGPTEALEFDVDAWMDTPTGRQKLTFHFRQLSDTRITELEAEHRQGEGPFAEVDRIMLNAAKVAEATVYLQDADGRKVEIDGQEFRGPIPSSADAMRGRFKFQPGILSMVASEIDGAAGMRNDRVGAAKRSTEKTPSAESTIASTIGKS